MRSWIKVKGWRVVVDDGQSYFSGHLICLPSHVHLMGVVDGGVFPNFIFDLVGLR